MLSYPSAAFRAVAPRGTVLELWDGKDVPSGLNVGGINGRLLLNKLSLVDRNATFPDADIEVQSSPEVINASWTARNHAEYTVIATATATDPSPVNGHYFGTIVHAGTATIGGVAYSTPGARVIRLRHAGAWSNYVYPHLDAAWTWTQAQTFSADSIHRGVGGAPSVAFSSTQLRADGYRVVNSSAAVDNRIWDLTVSGTSLLHRSVNDAFGSAYTWLTVNRSGVNVTDVRFDATTGVGIGVTPTSGQGFLQGGAATDQVGLHQTGATTSVYFGSPVTGGIKRVSYNRSTGELLFIGGSVASPSTQMNLDNTGNLGIGVAPTAGNGLLQLASGTTRANGIAFGTDSFIYRKSAAASVFDGGTATDTRWFVECNTNAVRAYIIANSTVPGVYFGSQTNHTLYLRTNDADRIVIDTNGNTSHLFAIADRSLVLYTPASGTTQTIANNVSTAIIQGTLASLTVQMPAAPVDGQIVRVIFNATITTLTISANAGQTLASGSPTSSALGATVSYIYRASGATWYILGKNA